MSTVFRPFLMDEEKDDFVVFILEREEDANAYVWARLDSTGNANRDVRITSFYGLCAYCSQTSDPFYIGEIPQESIDQAMQRIENCPEDKMSEMLREFSENMNAKASNEKILKEYYEWEDKALAEVEEARSKGETLYYF